MDIVLNISIGRYLSIYSAFPIHRTHNQRPNHRCTYSTSYTLVMKRQRVVLNIVSKLLMTDICVYRNLWCIVLAIRNLSVHAHTTYNAFVSDGVSNVSIDWYTSNFLHTVLVSAIRDISTHAPLIQPIQTLLIMDIVLNTSVDRHIYIEQLIFCARTYGPAHITRTYKTRAGHTPHSCGNILWNVSLDRYYSVSDISYSHFENCAQTRTHQNKHTKRSHRISHRTCTFWSTRHLLSTNPFPLNSPPKGVSTRKDTLR